MKLTRLAVEKRTAAGVLAAALAVLGGWALSELPVDFLPEVTYPLVRVDVPWPGATPEEIDTNIAEIIERQIATVDGLDYLSSESREGRYQLEVNFRYGVDVDVAYQDVLAAMSRATPRLPDDVETPIVFKADPSQLPVVQLPIRSTEWDLVTLRSWAERWLEDQVVGVEGVGGTEVVGGLRREIRVHVDPEALQKYEIALGAVVRRIEEENLQQFAGRITIGPRERIARTDGELATMEELSEIVLRNDPAGRVLLSDVARVRDHHEPARLITRFNGADGVRLSVNKQADANTVEVVRAVQRRMAELKPSLPEHVRIGYMEDQAQYVSAALAGVRNVVIAAAVLVILVIYFFLGSLRQVLVMATVLPVILIVNFALMRLLGFSLNIFSLGGLVIAVGVVLDNSTVVLENIARRREAEPDKPLPRLAVDATRQVGPAIVAATLAYMALFTPFLLVPGLASLLMRELILVIAGVVAISLLAAVTLTPMLAVTLAPARTGAAKDGPSRFQRFFAAVTRNYGRSLTWLLEGRLRLGPRRWLSFRPRRPVAAGFAGLAVAGLLLLPQTGFEFLPGMDDGRVTVRVNLPTGASVEQTDRVVRRVEDSIIRQPFVDSVFALSGGRSRGLFTQENANEGELNVQLVPRRDRPMTTEAFVRRLRRALSAIEEPGATIQMRPASARGIRAGAGGPSDIVVKLQGTHVPTLFELATETAETLRTFDYLTNVHISMDMERPEFQVRLDRTRAADLGLSVTDAAHALRTLVGGTVATRYKEDDQHYDIRVMVEEAQLGSRMDVTGLLLDRPGGGKVRLHEIADVREAAGPVEILRENQVRQVLISTDTSGVSLGEALARLERDLENVPLPAGYRFDYGGQAELMLDMQRTMLLIIAFAVFFAFVVLAVQFNRIKLPFLILVTLPVCLAGMVFALWGTGLALGATVVIGLLVVVAATVNDGVLLLNFAEDIRKERGLSPAAAVVEAACIRLRPRVMTSVSVIAGLFPLALNLGEGGDMLQPMAVAAIGGLTVEILVALFLMPLLYVIFSRSPPPMSDPVERCGGGQGSGRF